MYYLVFIGKTNLKFSREKARIYGFVIKKQARVSQGTKEVNKLLYRKTEVIKL
jgi:hypothetical protein